MTTTTPLNKDKESIRQMFNNIAYKYDFLNHFLSLNIDKLWRKKLVRIIKKDEFINPAPYILDIATGTGDLAIEASRILNIKIIGVDIAEGMLAIGEKKINKKHLTNTIKLQVGDAENLPFSDNTFDCAMVAFGVRNFSNLQNGLADSYRVLKPGGRLYVMEFSTPQTMPFKQLYALYFKYCLPVLGHLFSKNAEAYSYLNKSVLEFPQGQAFLAKLSLAGFNNIKLKSLSLGIASIYIGEKKQ